MTNDDFLAGILVACFIFFIILCVSDCSDKNKPNELEQSQSSSSNHHCDCHCCNK